MFCYGPQAMARIRLTLFIAIFLTAPLLLGAGTPGVKTFCETWLTPEESILEAQAEAARILAARAHPISEDLIYPPREVLENLRARGLDTPHAEQWTMWGVPFNVTQIEHGDMIFRHYTTVEGLEAILASGGLQTGYVGYIEASPNLYHKEYPDLSGVYLTLPQVNRRAVGVDEKGAGTRFAYMDIRINKEIPVLRITKDIFLIGLRPRTRSWMANYFYQSEAGLLHPNSALTYSRAIDELSSQGGPNTTPASVPFTIVGHGLVP